MEELQATSSPVVDAKLLDNAAVVQMLSTGTANTFQDYADVVSVPYVNSQPESANIIWEVYVPKSLKNTTRVKQGKGVCSQILPTAAIPRDLKGRGNYSIYCPRKSQVIQSQIKPSMQQMVKMSSVHWLRKIWQT